MKYKEKAGSIRDERQRVKEVLKHEQEMEKIDLQKLKQEEKEYELSDQSWETLQYEETKRLQEMSESTETLKQLSERKLQTVIGPLARQITLRRFWEKFKRRIAKAKAVRRLRYLHNYYRRIHVMRRYWKRWRDCDSRHTDTFSNFQTTCEAVIYYLHREDIATIVRQESILRIMKGMHNVSWKSTRFRSDKKLCNHQYRTSISGSCTL